MWQKVDHVSAYSLAAGKDLCDCGRALVRTEARASHLKSDHFSFDSSIMYTLSWSACIFKERKKTQRIIIKVKESSNDVALCNR